MIIAIIMAGGRGERFESPIEKPLFQLDNKALIDYVIDNVNQSGLIEKAIIAISPNTDFTKEYLINKYGLLNYADVLSGNIDSLKSLEDYYKSLNDKDMSDDLTDNLNDESVTTLDDFVGLFDEYADLRLKFSYFDTSGNGYVEDLGDILSFFEKKTKDDILVFINADLPLISAEIIDYVLDYYLTQDKPALSTVVPVEVFDENDIPYSYEFNGNVPSGLNILRSENIVQNEETLVIPSVELAYNVNTLEAANDFNKFLNKDDN